MTRKAFLLFIVFALLLAACGGEAVQSEQPAAEQAAQPPPEEEIEEPAPAEPTLPPVTEETAPEPVIETPIQEPAAEEPAVEEPAALELLPAEPQIIEFASGDGTILYGTYYPGAVNPAPIVVLIHQINFDETQWKAIAPWLQNRGQVAPGAALPSPGLASPPRIDDGPWFDPSWFPLVPEDLNVAVFTFTLRDCKGGCSGFQREDWREDAYAGILAASMLEGVDPAKVMAVGTSIGADGVVDGCKLYMDRTDYQCQAVMPVSPGSYLAWPFDETVLELNAAGTPVLCFSAEKDSDSFATCTSLEDSQNYESYTVPGAYHGIYAVDPQVEDPWLQPMLDLLRLGLGLDG
jgi:dienelactone hydrolase